METRTPERIHEMELSSAQMDLVEALERLEEVLSNNLQNPLVGPKTIKRLEEGIDTIQSVESAFYARHKYGGTEYPTTDDSLGYP